MSIATMELTRSTQHLIDSRLDTIDRMLLGRVSRSERLQIVREVEGQIFEQLQERGGEGWSREDVLHVLARLDPPEAYLPDDEDGARPTAPRPSAAPRMDRDPSGREGRLRLAKAGAILGMVSMTCLLALPVVYMIAVAINSEIFLFGLGGMSCLVAFVGGVLAVTFAALSRMANAWAVTGLITGILAECALVTLALVIVLDGI